MGGEVPQAAHLFWIRWEYDELRTVNDVTIAFETTSIEYLNGTETALTMFAYEWYVGTYESPAVIPEERDGTGVAYTRMMLFDISGSHSIPCARPLW